MKEDFNDIELKKLLQEKAYQPGKNRWFTPRLLNRLPEKTESGLFSVEMCVYVISLVLCLVGWIFIFKTSYFDVITIKSLICIIALIIGSFVLVIQSIRTAFSF